MAWFFRDPLSCTGAHTHSILIRLAPNPYSLLTVELAFMSFRPEFQN